MTRNSKQDLPSDGTHKKMCDVVASASVLCNSAGLESLRCKCLGVEELREFLATYQEEPRTEWAIMELIQVGRQKTTVTYFLTFFSHLTCASPCFRHPVFSMLCHVFCQLVFLHVFLYVVPPSRFRSTSVPSPRNF